MWAVLCEARRERQIPWIWNYKADMGAGKQTSPTSFQLCVFNQSCLLNCQWTCWLTEIFCR